MLTENYWTSSDPYWWYSQAQASYYGYKIQGDTIMPTIDPKRFVNIYFCIPPSHSRGINATEICNRVVGVLRSMDPYSTSAAMVVASTIKGAIYSFSTHVDSHIHWINMLNSCAEDPEIISASRSLDFTRSKIMD